MISSTLGCFGKVVAESLLSTQLAVVLADDQMTIELDVTTILFSVVFPCPHWILQNLLLESKVFYHASILSNLQQG